MGNLYGFLNLKNSEPYLGQSFAFPTHSWLTLISNALIGGLQQCLQKHVASSTELNIKCVVLLPDSSAA